jgi:hypothetical protein
MELLTEKLNCIYYPVSEDIMKQNLSRSKCKIGKTEVKEYARSGSISKGKLRNSNMVLIFI